MLDNRIISSFVKETFGFSDTLSFEIHKLSARGSDRTFYRVKWTGDKSAILIHYDPIRRENAFYEEIARFLKKISLNVPEVYRHDPDLHLILLEDLGDMDLYTLRNKPWDTRRVLYEKTLSNIKTLLRHNRNPFWQGYDDGAL
ncbi:MAG TPA: hypothetical protein PLW88_05790 [Syntrophorhabdaceae bacterium]|nr:hypothetical protein [Syntrophorhabdaceae bacterium]